MWFLKNYFQGTFDDIYYRGIFYIALSVKLATTALYTDDFL